jgi:asparagine synthase (glutamine-hydrolysing)
MDEQWAGYDYYQASSNGHAPSLVQGTTESSVRPECLNPEFRNLAEHFDAPNVYPDKLRNIQYRDARFTKIPRAMRFNDRISMQYSTELREPFLDHRLFELALRQPPERKINNGVRKAMLRQITQRLVPTGVSEAPKRPVQTPQREWLRGELNEWARDQITAGFAGPLGDYLDMSAVRRESERFFKGGSDNSFYLWQWISIGLMGRCEIGPKSLELSRNSLSCQTYASAHPTTKHPRNASDENS